jgi:hypothetical protein
MASYMALREGWTDKDGKVEPIQFEGTGTVRRPFPKQCLDFRAGWRRRV